MHTKGPWKVDRLRSIYQESDTESQDRIAEAFVMARREKNINNPSLVIQAQANARLIAEAPAMFGVISELLVELEHADPDWIGARLQSILDAGAEAIRKAKGD